MLFLKQFSENYYKLVLLKKCRKPFFESDDPVEREVLNDVKLDNNISRARSKCLEYGLCNEWDWFFTGTIDPKKFDRTDFDYFYKKFSKWLRNYSFYRGLNIKYLFIPEIHDDPDSIKKYGKCWHLHGLISGLPRDCLRINEYGYLDWPEYSTSFGFMSLAPVYSSEGVSLYITKYMSKDIGKDRERGKYLYYHSKCLNTSVTLLRLSDVLIDDMPWDFSNQYVYSKVLRKDQVDQLLSDGIRI